MKAQIVKGVGGKYVAYCNNQHYSAVPRGILKKDGKILIGDYVELEDNEFNSNEKIISKVFPRKNFLTRPPLSNIDQLIIVLAIIPKPDFILIDKLILSALINKIEPILVINKSDIANKTEINNIVNDYSNVCEKVIVTSAINNNNINELKDVLKDKLSVFAGQSAVGKSSILNAITNLKLNLKTNDVSKKTKRGTHTTRHSEIFVLNDNIKVADTPGFSMFDLDNLNPAEINLYYPEWEELKENCKYNNCTHINTNEKECAVVKALNNGLISQNRYNRYLEIYKSYLEKWRRKYD